MQKKILATIIFTVSALFLMAQEKKVARQNQQWIQYYNETRLGEKWVLLNDGGFRWKDGFRQSLQYIIRTGIGYSINPGIRVSAGFAHLGFYADSKLNKVEFRPYEELLIKSRFNKISITNRLRVEERFFNPVVNGKIQTPNSFNFRFRYSFMTGIPVCRLSKKHQDRRLFLNIGDEIFINVGHDIVYNVFDQNRLIISPTISLDKKLAVSLTWNSQFAATATPASYIYANVFWLQVKHTLGATHKKG